MLHVNIITIASPETRGQKNFVQNMKTIKFVMYKENRDTMSACSLLARSMHCKPHAFAFAGTKDKRGQTSQVHAFVFFSSVGALCAVMSTLRY
jgi:hypothetical protein